MLPFAIESIPRLHTAIGNYTINVNSTPAQVLGASINPTNGQLSNYPLAALGGVASPRHIQGVYLSNPTTTVYWGSYSNVSSTNYEGFIAPSSQGVWLSVAGSDTKYLVAAPGMGGTIQMEPHQ